MSTSQEIIPFGKYKGRPTADLIADRDYCEWLLAQPWFSERFRNTYTLVVNYGGQSEDSPEHNALQASFLDHSTCLRLAHRLGLPTALELGKRVDCDEDARGVDFVTMHYPHVARVEFETSGWDVRFFTKASYSYLRECSQGHIAMVRYQSCGCSYSDDGKYHPRKRGERYEQLCNVELKPSLGDDYPNVLRQVSRYPVEGQAELVVLIRDFVASSVSWEQVCRIFMTKRIHLLRILDLPDDAECFCHKCREDSR